MSMLPTRLRRALRSPWTITAELAGVALAGLASTLVEQHPGAAARARLAAARPAAAWLVQALGLDRVFTSGWFLLVVAAAACSLALVVAEQWRRAVREWPLLEEAGFRAAPYRTELVRPASGEGRRDRITARGRAAALGSPLFHTGLLVLLAAGAARMLFGAAAAREALEGDVIGADPGAFETQDRGLLAAPVALPAPVKLVELAPSHYPSGELLALSARIAGPAGPALLAVNAPLELDGVRLYLTQAFGPAAILELRLRGTATARAALLAPADSADPEWFGPLPGGLDLRLRAAAGPRRPDAVDVRVLSGGALIAAARLGPGGALALPEGGSLALREVRWWVRLVASRDPSAWPAYAGFALAVAGLALAIAAVRVDVLVVAEPAGAGERVVVALRPRRLAPLFAGEFDRLVRRESGRS